MAAGGRAKEEGRKEEDREGERDMGEGEGVREVGEGGRVEEERGRKKGKRDGEGEKGEGEGEGEEEGGSFEEMGLDPRLLRALGKAGIAAPTAVQLKCIPLALEGKDVVARARTGSGKTLAYVLPLLQRALAEREREREGGGAAGRMGGLVLVPTRELCQQVRDEVAKLAEFCDGQVAVSQLCTGMQHAALKAALQGPPDIVVATPGRVAACLRDGLLSPQTLKDSLQMLVLDEADLLLSYGYEDDVRSIALHVPRRCQCLLMSATVSVDVERLKKLVLHNPVTLTLTSEEAETESGERGGIPGSVQQYVVLCSQGDKLLYTLALLRLQLVPTKALIFIDTVEAAFRLRLFLEQFGIRSAVLNAELPQNSRLHILQEFNRGLFDYLIATDEGIKQKKKGKVVKEEMEELEEGEKEEVEDEEREEGEQQGKGSRDSKKRKEREAVEEEEEEAEQKGESEKRKKRKKGEGGTGEFGVVRGIDFKAVRTVINLSMPRGTTGYVHRVGRTGRAGKAGWAVSLVSPAEQPLLASIEADLASSASHSSLPSSSQNDLPPVISPFPLLTKKAVESLRYRAEDVARGVTKAKIREARAKELRLEMLNSERLKAHFEDNPRDRDLLQHDRVLTKMPVAPHLKVVPSYLRDATTEEASRALKAARNSAKKAEFAQRRISGRRATGGKDPLKSFAFRGKAKDEDEPPEVVAALQGTLWARKKAKENRKKGGKKKAPEGDGQPKNSKALTAALLGKFQSAKKHSRRKR